MSWLSRALGGTGYLGHFGLMKWWFAAFSAGERALIESRFLVGQPITLLSGTLIETSETPANLLCCAAETLNLPEHKPMFDRLFEKASECALNSGDVLQQHFVYSAMIQANYRLRDSVPGALADAIQACSRQITLSKHARRAMERDGPINVGHRGFRQLAIIYEKRGELERAIDVCREADASGWEGDWERRIARMESKLARHSAPVTIVFLCPNCERRLQAPAGSGMKARKCPACGQPVVAPEK